MQHVGDQGNLVKNGNDQPAGGLSPAKAFFALLALLVAIGGLFLLTRPGDEPNPGPAPKSDNFALTDAEAIDRFRELNSLALASIRERDYSTLNEIFAAESPARNRAFQAIQRLRRDNVIDKVRIEVRAIEVIQNDSDKVELRVIDRLFPCFVTESGEDISESHRVVEGTTVWTLTPEDSVWKIQDSTLENDHFVKGRKSACP
jgi:hypothetical protein